MSVKLLRPVALATALAALAVIGIRPSWRVGATSHAAVLVTPGADRQLGERLADSLGGVPLFETLPEVWAHRAGLTRVHVVGWGLDAGDWVRLESIPVTFHPVAPPAGFDAMSWPAQVVLGERVTVDGVLSRSAPVSRPLVELIDPTGVVDTAVVDSSSAFHVEVQPRAQGRMLYVVRARGTAIAETLGVQVLPPPVWRVLVLESAPRPETTMLVNWLARRQGIVAVRSTISRDRVHREFVNRPSTSLDVVTDALLAQFDLTMIDGRTLARLRDPERGALRRAVAMDGLGVLVVPDTIVRDPFFLDFALQAAGNLDERLVRPVWQATRAREAPLAAVAAAPYTLGARFGTATIVTDGFGHPLAQVAPRGAGRVALSLIVGSARWRRSGLADTYASYWSRLLAATATAHRDVPRWTIATPGPWLDGRPVAIEAAAPGALQPALVTGPGGAVDSVVLARDSTSSGRWRGLFWPRGPGWYRVAGDSGPAIYVQTAASWIGVRASARLAASRQALVGGEYVEPTPTGSLAVPARPVQLGWAFGLFLVAVGYLWSERRRLVPAAGSPADTGT